MLLDPYVTSGITNSKAVRVELHDFVKNEYQFSLLIQALLVMQDGLESDPASFFSIGGIHGMPYTRWTGDFKLMKGNSNAGGYCVHGMNLFPTWHRPYVALYEQILQQHALEIAGNYTVDREKWLYEADTLRLPYWDWANPDTVAPPDAFLGGDTVTIIGFDGRKKAVANPLASYTSREQQLVPGKTTRGSNDDPDTFKNNFDRNSGRLTQHSVKVLLETKQSWTDFSNHSYHGTDHKTQGRGNTNSIEAIHDNIHQRVGGWMYNPTKSGFDPLFFFHHCNVDRLLAIWQYMHPTVWVESEKADFGTYTIPKGSTIDASTSLAPFWKTTSAQFNSADIRDWRIFGSDYDDFVSPDISREDHESVLKRVHQRISERYGRLDPGVRNILHQDNPRVTEALRSSVTEEELDAVLDKLAGAFIAHTTLHSKETDVYKPHRLDYYQWSVQVLVKQYALKESFSVDFYLDSTSDNTPDDKWGPSYTGSFGTFVNPTPESCSNCQDQGDPVVEGFVYLNQKIAERSDVNSFIPEKILPWLSNNLSWRVKKSSGAVVPLSEIPSLEVTLVCDRLELEAGSTAPAHGKRDTYPAVNSGV